MREGYLTHKGMVSSQFGLFQNELAGQIEDQIGTLKRGFKSATDIENY